MSVISVFAGVSNVLVSDGETSFLIDGFFSRPSPLRILTCRLRPDEPSIRKVLNRLDVSPEGRHKLSAVFVSHSHIDHAFDAPVVADLTGATLFGSESTRLIAKGYEVEKCPFQELEHEKAIALGKFTITPIRALHSEPDRIPGVITTPVTVPSSIMDYRTGDCFSFHVAHPDGDLFIHPSANFIPGILSDYSAELVYLGVGGVGKRSEDWFGQYWRQTVKTLGARTVRTVHWDAFWTRLTDEAKPLPRFADNLPRTMERLTALAREDGIDIQFAVPWREEICGNSV